MNKNKMLCVVLSYNGVQDTIHCIETLLKDKPENMDILVVDNASQPGVVHTLRETFRGLHITVLPENLGWAGGNNYGIEYGLECGYDWIVLMNNDLVFPDGQAAALYNAVEGLPPCLLHPTIHYWDEPEVAQLDPARAYGGTEPWHGKVRMNFAYGACLAVHRQVFEQVGVFDERFFLQLEEADFHHRATVAGFMSVMDTNVKVFHKESRAFGGKRAPIKTYYSVRNTLLFIEKNHPKRSDKIKALKQLLWSFKNLADDHVAHEKSTLRFMLSASPSSKAVRAGFTDYLLRRFGKASSNIHSKLSA